MCLFHSCNHALTPHFHQFTVLGSLADPSQVACCKDFSQPAQASTETYLGLLSLSTFSLPGFYLSAGRKALVQSSGGTPSLFHVQLAWLVR